MHVLVAVMKNITELLYGGKSRIMVLRMLDGVHSSARGLCWSRRASQVGFSSSLVTRAPNLIPTWS